MTEDPQDQTAESSTPAERLEVLLDELCLSQILHSIEKLFGLPLFTARVGTKQRVTKLLHAKSQRGKPCGVPQWREHPRFGL